MRRLQTCIDQLAAACKAKGISEVVISPGSRSAPLCIAFARSGAFNCHPAADERNAGFLALGMAIASQKPVAIICTSGTALANLMPAVIESFYQRVPLVLLTADRPPELIDQWDGQTIRQQNFFHPHIKDSFQTPDQYHQPEVFFQIAQQAIIQANSGLPGPVHLNVPLREPLYPNPDYQPVLRAEIKRTEGPNRQELPNFNLPSGTIKPQKFFLLAGFSHQKQVLFQTSMPFGNDAVSAYPNTQGLMEQVFMFNLQPFGQQLKPDLLISTGTSVVSKNLKNWIRSNKPKNHLHFHPQGDLADPFDTQPQLFENNWDHFLSEIGQLNSQAYTHWWQQLNTSAIKLHQELMDTPIFSEFKAYQLVIDSLLPNTYLHAGNSMAVRYVALCKKSKQLAGIWCNRGTSGIDGCVSTTLGFAQIKNLEQHVLLVGDVSFFYDGNAFWNKLRPKGLKIIVMNNGGGGIFRLIDGPAKQPELADYFETKHNRTAKQLCLDFQIPYLQAKDQESLLELLPSFLGNLSEGPMLLEVFTNEHINQSFFYHYKQRFHAIEIQLGNH